MSRDERASTPGDVLTVTRRYHRVERLASTAFALGVGTVAAVAFVTLSLGPGLLIAVGVLLGARAPFFYSAGTARWRTDADPDAVRAAFEGPTPPPLVLQWGVADRVDATASTAVYEFSYLFGLRSTRMTVEAATVPPDGSDDGDDHGGDGHDGGVGGDRGDDGFAADLELRVTAGGAPWGDYRVSITTEADATVVDLVVLSRRRFGVHGLPQWLLAARYQPIALDALGYDVEERDVGLAF